MTKLEERHLVAAEVLREKGWSIRAAAKELGVDESTLRYRLRRRQEKAVDGRTRQGEACAVHAPVIDAWIARQEGVPRSESVKMLYEELTLEHGFTGSYKSLLRYVRRRAPRPPVRPIRRVETRPGAQAQVDWVQTRLIVEELGGWVKLSAFMMTLSHSRMWAVIWAASEDLLNWIHCHNESFTRLGGIPSTLRIDNLKTGVTAGAGSWAVLHRGYLSYADQVGFYINPARLRTPRDKGKVERRGRDLKWVQVRRGERFLSLQTLQAVTDQRIRARAARLICPVTGRPILESWKAEQLELGPLPISLPQPFDVQVTREVQDGCLVNFEGRQYSVPFRLTGQSVEVRGGPGRVEIYASGERVACYPRGTECRLLIDQQHYEGPGSTAVIMPTPLGRVGREIVLPRSWEAPRRPIDQYELALRSLQ